MSEDNVWGNKLLLPTQGLYLSCCAECSRLLACQVLGNSPVSDSHLCNLCVDQTLVPRLVLLSSPWPCVDCCKVILCPQLCITCIVCTLHSTRCWIFISEPDELSSWVLSLGMEGKIKQGTEPQFHPSRILKVLAGSGQASHINWVFYYRHSHSLLLPFLHFIAIHSVCKNSEITFR